MIFSIEESVSKMWCDPYCYSGTVNHNSKFWHRVSIVALSLSGLVARYLRKSMCVLKKRLHDYKRNSLGDPQMRFWHVT